MARSPSHQSREAPSGPKGRLLLVDDDDAIRELISVTLADEGYEVVAAPDGATALALIGPPGHWRPDLILLDMQMEGMDGPSFASAYGEANSTPGSRAPIVLLTAMPGIDAARATDHVGAAGFLVKPFDIDTLVSLVDHHTGTRPDRRAAGETARVHRTPHQRQDGS